MYLGPNCSPALGQVDCSFFSCGLGSVRVQGKPESNFLKGVQNTILKKLNRTSGK